jgi:hypothetical protein
LKVWKKIPKELAKLVELAVEKHKNFQETTKFAKKI